MRNAFAEQIYDSANANDNVVLLSGDIGNKVFDNFKKSFPKRFYNCGISEQNMTSVATGLAMSGLNPVTYSIAPFNTIRCLEQIRTGVAYHNVPVIIIGVGAGLAYAELGPSHHSCEDISFVRTIPNMTVLCPADRWEVKASLKAAIQSNKPTYIRIGKKGEQVVHKKEITNFKIGKPIKIKSGEKKVCILSTGNIMPEILNTSDQLNKYKINPAVYSFHTIKPLNSSFLKRIFKQFDLIVTAEEHSIIGGLGSSISEWMVDHNIIEKKLLKIALPDKFFKLSGSHKFARDKLGISSNKILKKILKLQKVKK
ncbi:MAG: transketolase [Candidatus Pelagibacter sp. TMED197]|nr:MAG: transketolase [Candidatus Pelagibacter sp. TMED197]